MRVNRVAGGILASLYRFYDSVVVKPVGGKEAADFLQRIHVGDALVVGGGAHIHRVGVSLHAGAGLVFACGNPVGNRAVGISRRHKACYRSAHFARD